MTQIRIVSFESSIGDVLHTFTARDFMDRQLKLLEADKLVLHNVMTVAEAEDIQDIFSTMTVVDASNTIPFFNFVTNVCMYARRKREAGKLETHRLSSHDTEDYVMDAYTGSRQILKTDYAQGLCFEDIKYLVSVVAYHCYDHLAYIKGRTGSHIDLDSINENYAIEALDNKTIRAHKALVQATVAQEKAEAIPLEYIEKLEAILDKADKARFLELLSKKVQEGITKTEAKAYQRLVNKVMAQGQKLEAVDLKAEKARIKAKKEAFKEALREDKAIKVAENKAKREAQKAKGQALREEAQAKRLNTIKQSLKDLGLSDTEYKQMLANRAEADTQRREAKRLEAKKIRQMLKGTL